MDMAEHSRLQFERHVLNKTGLRLNDHATIIFASPFVGMGVAWVTGVLHDSPENGIAFWLSRLFLVAIAFVLWYGNRWLYFLVRDRASYQTLRASPRRRIVIMVAVAVAYSAPVAFITHVAWYSIFVAGAMNWTAIYASTALVTVTSLFFAHAYEAILLGREQLQSLVAAEAIELQRLETEVHAMESQLDPHFIYNALCSLGFLIETNRERAGAYVVRLSSVYAYVTKNFTVRLVGLGEELAFARAFAELLKLRHADAIIISIPDIAISDKREIVPISIQLALENAAKHNDFSAEIPLRIDVVIVNDKVEVRNNLLPLSAVVESTGVGLPSLSSRCRLALGQDIAISKTRETFAIRIPVRG
jgi:hypothetical protein